MFLRSFTTFALIAVFVPKVSSQEETSCTLCAGGGNVAYPDRVVPHISISENKNPTCQAILEAASLLDSATTRSNSGEACKVLQAQQAFCGCPGTSEEPINACSLCPNGEAPANGSLRTPFGDTCDELDFYLSYFSADECTTDRAALLQGSAFMCGCQDATTTCAMCPDGTINLDQPERVIPFLEVGGQDPTCEEFAHTASVLGDGQIDCEIVQQQAGYCGCEGLAPLNICSFCSDGGEPSNLGLVATTEDTCDDLNTYVSFLDEAGCGESERLESIRNLDFVCGCSGTEPDCTLCPDGSNPPNPDTIIDNEGTTCADVAATVASLGADSCAAQETDIAANAARCGCEGAEFPQCTVQQNAQLCTTSLLESTNAVCECYSFCDGEFVECSAFPGSGLFTRECPGVAVTGCNMALANAERDDGMDSSSATSWSKLSIPGVLSLVVIKLL